MAQKKKSIDVMKALELINVDEIEHTYNNFQTCHSWHFIHEGVELRLVQHEGIKLKLETQRLPRTTLDQIPLTEDMDLYNRHINL